MLSFVLLSTFSIQILTILPLFVGVFAETHGFNEAQLGILAAADLVGASLACVAIFIYVDKLSWRTVILISTLLSAAANLLCGWSEQYGVLVLLRLIAGASAGAIYALAMVAIARSQQVTRDYGWAVAGQALLASFYYVTLPSLIEGQGLPSLFIVMAANMLVCGLLLPTANTVGQSSAVSDEPAAANSGHSQSTVVPALAGILLLYIAQGGIWAFVERIGHAAGHSPETIGYALAVAALLGIAAGATAALQGERLGFSLPLWLVFVGQTLAMLLLWQVNTYLGYLLAITLYNFCWTYVVPFHMGIIAQCHASGRVVALAPAIQGLGLAAGAAIAGATLEANNSYLVLYQLATMLGGVSLLLMLAVVKGNRRSQVLILEEEVG
ncbi:MAG: MFS transporter [Gammaproteobacteria bacterium]|nr:MFS transporter [Gammaproteobacteria bacterium]